MLPVEVITILLISILGSFLLSFPIIDLLYRFRVTRRGEADFSNLIEKRKLKIGVPVMGGLIIVTSVIVLNLSLNYDCRVGFLLILFSISALLGAADDMLNIFGYQRRVRTIQMVNKLIRVHASKLVRLRLLVSYPWYLYTRFFFMLGSNPGKGIMAHEKIIVQVLVGGLLGWWMTTYAGMTTVLEIPFVGGLDLGVLFMPFVIAAVVLMTNAVNIADGLDGLSSIQLLASFSAFLVIAFDKGIIDLQILIITIIGSLVGYLYFNIPPARVQMGDVGSLSLGTMLAAIAFVLGEPIQMLLISLPFVITLLSTVIQGIGRRVLGRRIFLMAPIHHHFEMLGWSEEKVVMRFGLFSALCALVGLWLYFLAKVI